jgi:NYN domain
MKRDEQGPVLSAIFVDYDNIYMSLKRKNDEAAKRFAKLSQDWLKGVESGALITATNGVLGNRPRRIVMNRCYGNPVPRRNSHDNATDMNSFPFIRHHFLRAGSEVVDCPPLTAQLKNSSDIRMVMDIRDYLTHDTYFDEFVILSGDADFTPVLQRLRQHARRTVIYCNEYTAQPYTAICDGEVREADLIALLLAQEMPSQHTVAVSAEPAQARAPLTATTVPNLRQEIIAEVVSSVRAATGPVPLEALADRALRILGHEKTVNSSWAGAGSFRELLRQSLPSEIQLSDQPPYFAYDPKRHAATSARAQPHEAVLQPVHQPALVQPEPRMLQAPQPQYQAQVQPPRETIYQDAPVQQYAQAAQLRPQPAEAFVPHAPQTPPAAPAPQRAPSAAAQVALQQAPQRPAARQSETMSQMQNSIARIYEACQAPPLAPAEYRAVFEILAEEINENSLSGTQTVSNVVARAQARGFDLKRDDARFILEVVSEADPWFDQGASAVLFGGRFRNFVVARCRGQGLALSAEELDLIDNWFAGAMSAPQKSAPAPQASEDPRGPARWWPQAGAQPEPVGANADEDFPRIVRTRRA